MSQCASGCTIRGHHLAECDGWAWGRDEYGEPEDTRRLVAWLDPHLEWVASQPWAADMIADLVPATGRALARWPVQEPERRVTVRCPAWGAGSLVIVPPSVPGADLLVRCTLPACGSVLTEEDWDRTRSWALTVAQSGQVEAAAS